MKRFATGVLAPILAGVLGLALLLFYTSPAQLAAAFRTFDLRYVAPLLLLAIADYGLRFWRWHLLSRFVTGRDLPAVPNLGVFLAANALLLAPARAGDWTRSVFARSLFGTPASVTAPVPLVERIVDVLIIACLALLGVAAFGQSPFIGLLGLALAAIALIMLGSGRATSACIAAINRLAGQGAAKAATSFFESLSSLWRPRPLLIAFGLGSLAWASECLIFYLVLLGLGFEPSTALAGQAAFIYPVANLAGSLSLLPGGLGVAEGSIATLTVSMTGADAATALAAAVIVRLVIVGFGVLTGLPGIVYVTHRSAGSTAALPAPEAPLRGTSGAQG